MLFNVAPTWESKEAEKEEEGEEGMRRKEKKEEVEDEEAGRRRRKEDKMKGPMLPAVPTQLKCGLTLSMAKSSVVYYLTSCLAPTGYLILIKHHVVSGTWGMRTPINRCISFALT